MLDPRAPAEFDVAVYGAAGAGRTHLVHALLDFPGANETDLARFRVAEAEDALQAAVLTGEALPGPDAEGDEARRQAVGAALLVVRGEPDDRAREVLAALGARSRRVLVAVHARDLDREGDERVRDAWAGATTPASVYLTSTPAEGVAAGVEELRAALATAALDGVDVTLDQARKAKRPFATGIIAAAAVAAAAEGLLPGAAAFVITTQVGAITSLSYLYTGRWMGRGQALAMLPAFATQAAGGSVFLLVKSFLPPTGVADAAAAVVAASMTLAMLGAVTWSLERGYSLQEKKQLMLAFRRLRARTVAERAEILRNRARWRERGFWDDLVQRLIFEN